MISMLEEILQSGFAEMGITPDAAAVGKYRTYYEHLTETNKVMNLTAIEGETDVARLHFLDCASLLALADFKDKRVTDIGTGAGFPGLALKIAEPSMKLCLLDSLDKRMGFLSALCGELGFDDVKCVHARAEEIPDGMRDASDIVLSRAVARLNLLCELCLPYVRPGGIFIAMKGPDCGEELDEARGAVKLLGGRIEECRSITVPGTDIVHSAVIIKKLSNTPAKYPRRWAQIKKQPL